MPVTFVPVDSFISNLISHFSIEMTQQCNFRCVYCCYSGNYKNYRSHSGKHISKGTIDAAISFINSYSHKTDLINVSFFGGEALLQLDDIEYIVSRLSSQYDNRISFDISTNGYLLSDSVVKRICKIKNLNISVSIDGCREIHDKYRITRQGKPTYNTIYSNLLNFKRNNIEEYNKRIRLLITLGSLKDAIIINKEYDQFKEILSDKPLFISHIIPNFNSQDLYRDSIEEKRAFYETALEHKKNNISDISTLLLDELLKKTKKRFLVSSSGKVNVQTCLNMMNCIHIDCDGNLFPCEKFSTNLSIGDVWNGFDRNAIQKISHKYALRKTLLCSDCKLVEYCNRCLTDLKLSFSESKIMCQDYIENINLAFTIQNM